MASYKRKFKKNLKPKKILTLIAIAFGLQINAQLCFNPVTNYGVGKSPRSITSGDFSNNGTIDLVTADVTTGGVITFLEGDGAGGFSFINNYTVGCTEAITSADFNSDGNRDIAMCCISGNYGAVKVLFGNGGGYFLTSTTFTTSIQSSSIISADFNGDSKIDIAVAGDYVAIFLNTGSGSFGTPSFGGTISSYNSYSMISANFNGDANLDIAVAYSSSDKITVMLGNGTGGISSSKDYTFAVNSRPYSLCSEDFDMDGKKDLAVVTRTNSEVAVLLGDGLGNFGVPLSFTVNTPSSIISNDFNGDGKKDLAVANNASVNTVSVLLGMGTGNFVTATTFTLGAIVSNNYPYSIISADFDGNGSADLALGSYTLDTLSVLLNCNATTGINSIIDTKLNIYPNPSNGSFAIETNATRKQTVNIYDVNGRVVLSQVVQPTPNPSTEGNSITVDAGSLQNGIYNVSIMSNEGVVNKRLVIVR